MATPKKKPDPKKKVVAPKLTAEQLLKKKIDENVAKAINLLRTNQATVKTLPKELYDAIVQKYGRAAELFASDPELRKILYSQRKKDGTLEPLANFSQQIQSSKWLTDRTNDQRWYDSRKDLPDAKAQLAKDRADLLDRIQRTSVEVSGKKLSDLDAGALADDLLRNNNNQGTGVSDGLITLRVRAKAVDVFTVGGSAQTTATNLRGFASEMGVSLTDAAIGTYVDQIYEGNQTEENVKNLIREYAASYFGSNKAVADRIRAGETTSDIFRMQRDLIASLHEEDPGNIKFTDPRMSAIISGGESGAPMNYTETRRYLKSLPQYDTTKTAMDEAAGITQALMRMFGAGV